MPHSPEGMKINGQSVIDSKKPVHIKILKSDCQKGASKDPGACAAARACLRDIPGCKAARVHINKTYLQIDDKWVRYLTPPALRTEIVSFDRGAMFQPGEFVLRAVPPSEVKGRGKKHSKPTLSRGRPGKQRPAPRMLMGVRQHGANR